jgi:asparagine synthase (glutamine-hydrolysing)
MAPTGCHVTLDAGGQAEFEIFCRSSLPSPDVSLVTFAKDAATGAAAVLIGPIYYRESLLARLPSGVVREAVSDAELALAVFRHYGTQGLQGLEGEFAAVFLDPKVPRLIVVRDPVGSWPLFWADDGKSVRVSTSLLALARRLSRVTINRGFLATFLVHPFAFSEVPVGETVLDPVHRVSPGDVLALYPGGRANRLQRWDWVQQTANFGLLTREEAGAGFLELFRAAVAERLRRGKVAAHLSGGLDSSSVVCVATDLLMGLGESRRLTTLSSVYKGHGLAGETRYVRMIIDRAGVIDPVLIPSDQHTDYRISGPDLPPHDEPYLWLVRQSMSRHLIDEAHRRGVSTVLTGVGAELILDSSPWSIADRLREGHWGVAYRDACRWAEATHTNLREVLVGRGVIAYTGPAALREGVMTLLRGGYGRWPKLGRFDIPPWILPTFARAEHMWTRGLEIARQFGRYPVEQSFRVAGLDATRGDWTSWFVAAPKGLRQSHPFRDPRVVTFALGLLENVRTSPGEKEPVLREAMKGILPEPIRVRRHKRGFDDLYSAGLNQSLPELETMISRSKISELGIFDLPLLTQVLREHAMGIGNAMVGSRINASLAVLTWYDQLESAVRSVGEPSAVHRILTCSACKE